MKWRGIPLNVLVGVMHVMDLHFKSYINRVLISKCKVCNALFDTDKLAATVFLLGGQSNIKYYTDGASLSNKQETRLPA